MWKYLVCVFLLTNKFIISSSETSKEVNFVDVYHDRQQSVENKLQSIEITETDLAKIFPNQKEKIAEVLHKLSLATTDKAKVAILNDFTDECLKHLNEFLTLNSVDPLPLEDLVTGFEFRFLFITYWAEMSLRNGWLQGIGSMERRGDVTLTYEYPHLKVHASAGFKKLLYNYDYLIKFMGLGPSGGIDGSVDACKYTFDLTINLTNLRADLEKFKLNTLGKVRLKFNGYIWLDWFVNLCVKVALIGVKPILRVVIQGFVTNLLNGMCDIYNDVICQILGDCPGGLANLLL